MLAAVLASKRTLAPRAGWALLALGAALAVGVTVVTVSGGNVAGGGGADGVVAAGGADVMAGCEVVTGGATVVDTEPLSPPPRITTVQTTATSRIAPATPAIQTHRRSIGS
jgi:hypothetical protein